MRIFIIVLVLTFGLHSITKADDIGEFEIEGMSVGDSLLNYMKLKEIKDATKQTGSYYKDNKYVVIITNIRSQKYDGIEVTYVPNEKKFLIENLSGIIRFPDNFQECKKYKSNIVDEIKHLYKKAYTYDSEEPHAYDEFSFVDETVFYPKYGGYVRISCTDWSEQMYTEYGWEDKLDVTIGSEKFKNFLIDEAYE